MDIFCKIWKLTDVKWSEANWKWSECGGIIPPQPVASIGNLPGVDATTLIQPWQIEEPWDAYKELKKKRLIKLICKVKNENYDEEKEVKDIKMTIEDVKMVVKVMPKIDLNLKLEE